MLCELVPFRQASPCECIHHNHTLAAVRAARARAPPPPPHTVPRSLLLDKPRALGPRNVMRLFMQAVVVVVLLLVMAVAFEKGRHSEARCRASGW